MGLVPASREVAQVVGVVNVIFHPAVGFEREQPGVHVANHLAPLVRKPDDAQPLSVRMGIFAQGGDDPGEIPFADGLHVPDLLPAPDLEADHQEAVDHGPGTVVHRLPAVHVGECEVAVVDARRHGIALDGLFILEAHGFEFNHGRCNSFFCVGIVLLDKGAEILQEGVPCARRFRFVLRVVEADRAVVRHGLERPVPAHRPLLSLRFVQHVAAECEIGLRIAQQP